MTGNRTFLRLRLRLRRSALPAALAAMALLVSACGDDGGGGGGSGGKNLTLIQGVTNEPFYITMACGAKDAARAAGYSVSVTGPAQWDASQQTSVVNSVTAKHPDAVLIAPVDSQAMIAPLRQMKNAGVKIVQVDTNVTDMSVGASWISSDNAAGGRLAAKSLAKLTGHHGTVLIVDVKAGTSTTDARNQGFRDELKNDPGITVLTTQYDNDDPAKAASVVTSTLAAHPDLAGIFATNLNSTSGAATGLRQAGKQGKVKLVGFDAEPKEIEDLKNGSVQAVVAQDPYRIGKLGVEQALKALSGKKTTATIKTGLVTITSTDVASMSKYYYKASC